MRYDTSALIVNEDLQVLARLDGESPTLPMLSVATGRAGITLSRAVREQLGLDVFGLVVSPSPATRLQPMRLQSEGRDLPNGYFWIDWNALDPNTQRMVHALSEVSISDMGFGQYAWYTAVRVWIDAEIKKLGYRVRSLEQWNGRIGGVLLRVDTDGPSFWFKAVSDFNAREIGVAKLLAAKHPSLFPTVVASQPAWGAFLLEHIEGRELYECDDITIWRESAALLAEMQLDWVGQADDLLTAGAADLRADAMIAKLPGFLNHIDDAMARQPKTPPNTLLRSDLDELEGALYSLCGEVQSLPFADGLANADFSPHNTLITSRGAVFIDWAEACVSLPLIAGEYLWNRMVVESPERASWQETLRQAYLDRWIKRYGKGPIERAAELLPAFSILAVAMFYHERECHGSSPYDSYLRSLARKLSREVMKLPLQSVAVHT